MTRKVMAFHYVLTNKNGEEIDSSKGKEPLMFMTGAGQIIPGLEKQVAGLKKGDKKKITVLAPEAYGKREEALVVKVSRDKLPAKKINIGDRFRGGNEDHAPVFTITDITLSEVTLDGNHSLAGEDLTFDIEVTDVRDATTEEMDHGHSHGGDGHSH